MEDKRVFRLTLVLLIGIWILTVAIRPALGLTLRLVVDGLFLLAVASSAYGYLRKEGIVSG